jgi:hypothetical protein
VCSRAAKHTFKKQVSIWANASRMAKALRDFAYAVDQQ